MRRGTSGCITVTVGARNFKELTRFREDKNLNDSSEIFRKKFILRRYLHEALEDSGSRLAPAHGHSSSSVRRSDRIQPRERGLGKFPFYSVRRRSLLFQ